jgi:hypothetical protein
MLGVLEHGVRLYSFKITGEFFDQMRKLWSPMVGVLEHGDKLYSFKITEEFFHQMINYQLATDFHLPWCWFGPKCDQ